MEETHEQHKLHGFMQCLIYLTIGVEAAIFVYKQAPFWGFFYGPLEKLSHVLIYSNLLYSKLATLFLICLVSIGTLAKKKQELDPKLHIIYPLALGLAPVFWQPFCMAGGRFSFCLYHLVGFGLYGLLAGRGRYG